MSVLVARESFAAPEGVNITKGQAVDSKDPVIKGREHLFHTPEEAAELNAEPVLTATETPGEDDVLAEAVDAPPEDTDPEGAIEAAEAGEKAAAEGVDPSEAESVEDAPAGGLKTSSVPRRRRGSK